MTLMLSGIFLLLAMENRPVTEVSLQATVMNQILTPQQMFAWTFAGITLLYISEKDIVKNFQDFAFKERHAMCKTTPGTRSHHSFISISETVLEMQGWEKSIVIDIRLRYSLLFFNRIHQILYFLE